MTSRLDTLIKPNVRRWLVPIVASVLAVAATTAVLWLIEAKIDQRHLIFIYFAPTAWIAIRYGTFTAIGVTVASSLAAAYIFYPPHLSFLIDSPLDILELILFGLLAFLASQVVSGFANDELVAKRRRGPPGAGRNWYGFAMRGIRTGRR